MGQFMIQRNSKVPYYHQLYEILNAKIASGEWKPGDLLPAESELLEQYQVSRATVRQALDILVSKGQITRQRGRGSFVNEPTIEQTLTRIISFTEDMRQRGMVPGTHILDKGLIPASEDIAERLNMAPGEELAHLRRLRLADGAPMSIEDSFLIHELCPGVLEGDYTRQPLRDTLQQRYGLRLVHARQSIRAIPAPDDIALLLEIKAGAPLLFIKRVTYDDRQRPVEFIQFYHRGDRYALYSELTD